MVLVRGKLWDFAIGNFDLGVRGWRVHVTPAQVHPDSFLGPPSRLGTGEEGGLEEAEAGNEVRSQDNFHRSAHEVSPVQGSLPSFRRSWAVTSPSSNGQTIGL